VLLGVLIPSAFAGRAKCLLTDTADGSFVAKLAGRAGSVGERPTQPGPVGGESGQMFVAVRRGLSLDVEELVMKMMIVAMIIMLC
jgi:hypothetical protein